MSAKANTDQASAPNRMGAMPHANGVSFRVWAPHAEKVVLTGSFYDWNKTSAPMLEEKDGHWFADLPEPKPGDEYRFLIHGAEGLISRIDPYARSVTGAGGNGINFADGDTGFVVSHRRSFAQIILGAGTGTSAISRAAWGQALTQIPQAVHL